MEAALKWWNDALPSHEKEEGTANLLFPKDARDMWLKLCPSLFLFSSSGDLKTYWIEMQDKLKELKPSDTVPCPITRFPEFIYYVFQNKEVFSPRSLQNCVSSMSSLQFLNLNTFVIYTCPLLFRSPGLFVETIHELCVSSAPFWKQITSNVTIVESLIDMYQGFVAIPSKKSQKSTWKFRASISNFLFDLIFLGAKQPSHPYVAALKLADNLSELIGHANLESSVEFLMIIIRVYNILNASHPKDLTQQRFQLILKNFDAKGSDLFYLAVKYLYGLNSNVLPNQKILTIIFERGIRNLLDFQILLTLADEIILQNLMIFLVRTASKSKVWHRACMHTFRTLIVKYQQKSEAREWIVLYVRRIFAFIVLSNIKKKYICRATSYCEDMGLFLELKLPWLQIPINSFVTSSYATKRYPGFFRSFFVSKGALDETFVAEVDAFAIDVNVAFKSFPFDNSRNSLIAPPSIDIFAKRQVPRSSSSRSITVERPKPTTPQPKKEVQKKKVEKFIRKPVSGGRPITRPLASAIYIAPVNRR